MLVTQNHGNHGLVRNFTQLGCFNSPNRANQIPALIAMRTLGAITVAPIAGVVGTLWNTGRSITWVLSSVFTTSSETRGNRMEQARQFWESAKEDLSEGVGFTIKGAILIPAITASLIALSILGALQLAKYVFPNDTLTCLQCLTGTFTIIPAIITLAVLYKINASFHRLNPMNLNFLRFLIPDNQKWNISCKHSALKDSPEKELAKLANDPNRNSFKALKVTFLDDNEQPMAGIDAGGLSKGFISGLFEGLKARSERLAKRENEENATTEQVPFKFTQKEDGAFPSLLASQEPEAHQKEIEGYKTLGKLMGIALDNDYKIGNTFNVPTYSVISTFKARELTRELNGSFDEILNNDDRLLELFRAKKEYSNQFELLDSSIATLKANNRFNTDILYHAYPLGEFPVEFLNENGKVTLEKIEENYGMFQNALKATLLEYARGDSSKNELEAAFYIAQGLFKHKDRDTSAWATLTAQGGENLRSEIQGRLSAALIIEKLRVSDDVSRDFLTRWINDNNQDPKKLGDFVKVITGAPTLGAANLSVITNRSRSSDYLPEYHTCFNQIVLPGYNEYETFKAKLEQSIEEGLKGFQEE